MQRVVPPTAPRERNLTVDWLRVLGIGAVLVIHVCEVFNPWDEWHVSDPERSRLAGEVDHIPEQFFLIVLAVLVVAVVLIIVLIHVYPSKSKVGKNSLAFGDLMIVS